MIEEKMRKDTDWRKPAEHFRRVLREGRKGQYELTQVGHGDFPRMR